ncbi:DUF5077 domain-containing protein [Chitinophaga sedimenti]|uniref:DUF3472 domain-containing protein n=1 Tax=Chitinophaga sedimenti TaxID=2033606 RepID=UPI002003975C|nr:DUF5077 domain-containing protein [Chitinophaga sedimenti]MCK7553620.1 DUF5077 domain-containing protein [Chitinophaga sedimenti]
MKIPFITGTALLCALLFSCSKKSDEQAKPDTTAVVPPATSYSVPLAGNGFVTTLASGGAEVITGNGLGNWTNANSITSVYFRLGLTGTLNVSIRAKVAPSGSSNIKVTVNGTVFNKTITGSSYATHAIGSVTVGAAGYIKVDLQGVSKTGSYFGDVSDIIISGAATANNVVYANDAANYYWSRRGPSVHLGYTIPSGNTAEWMYSEVTVPIGEDKIGSYYMANGFNGGYFGIQVNSATERRILFSVWDPGTGTTSLVRKGTGVTDNSFGGEGTGGQSYLVFNWVAGNTYRFLTQAKPDGAGATDFSAWVYTPESATWRFIATWKRPNTVTYLTGIYSFLECFSDVNGYQGRKALYGNQWIRNTSGTWVELTTANFTADATATADQRRDYAGGLESGKFYLRNGGFFSNYVSYNQPFTRTATGTAPTVNLTTLP